MKTNLNQDELLGIIDDLKKKFDTLQAKVLMDKGDYRNIALMVEPGSKGSKLASEKSERETRNVCDHVMRDFIKRGVTTRDDVYISMHDGAIFFNKVEAEKRRGAKVEIGEYFGNENQCYCKMVRPEKPAETKKPDEKLDKVIPLKGKQKDKKEPKTLDKELRKESRSENGKVPEVNLVEGESYSVKVKRGAIQVTGKFEGKQEGHLVFRTPDNLIRRFEFNKKTIDKLDFIPQGKQVEKTEASK